MEPAEEEELTRLLPAARDFAPEVRRGLAEAPTLRVAAGAVLFRPGELCLGFPIILAGRVRVDLVAANGREVLLYRLGPAEACVMSTACLMSGDILAAEGRAETECLLRLVPSESFARLIGQCAAFRAFVLRGFGERLASMMARLDELAFHPVAARLARLLLAAPEGMLAATHEALARETGTAREVVGRVLQGFARRGWVRVRDPAALALLADGDDVTDRVGADG